MPQRYRMPLALLAITLIALPIGMRLAGESATETALGRVSFSLRPAISGGAELFVPITEWGMRFRITKAPVLVRVEPRSINRDGALRVAAGDRSLIEASKRDLLGGAIKAGLVNALAILLVSVVLGLLLAGILGWPILLTGLRAGLTSAGLLFLLGLIAWATYAPSSFQSPSLYARGAELRQLIDTVERERSSGPGSYSGNFERVLRGASSFLASAPGAPGGSREILLASDIHNNAPALAAIAELSGRDPVFMPGDFGFQGGDAEAALLAPRVADLGRPVVASSGNHDSASLMLAMARSGVLVLGQKGLLLPDGSWQGPAVREISGLRVAGYRDPLEWRGPDPEDPLRIFSFSELPDGEEREAKAKRDLWRWWKGLPEKPEVLLVHQPSLAESLARRIEAQTPALDLAILVGHDHEQWLARFGGVSIVDGGSAGAGGLFGVGSEAAEIATLHFRRSSGDLEAADFVAVEPLGGASRSERVILDEVCPSCRYRISALLRAEGVREG